MKIGVLTFQTTTNYGACLQCMALTNKIISLGAQCETIFYKCSNIEKRELHNSIFISGIKNAPKHFVSNISRDIKARKINLFMKENTPLSQIKYDRKSIGTSNSKYDLFISGSDIIWELNVTGDDYTYYLDFVSDNLKKYSYSSSFGYDMVPIEKKETVSKLLSQYQMISVREIQGTEIIKNLIQKDVPVTADPTLLYPDSFWLKYEKSYRMKRKPFVLLYFDDMEHKAMRFAKEIAEKNGATVLYLTENFRRYDGVINIRNVSVGQFLWLIHNALCVVTGSYHGVLFSINYNTPFYYINRAHKSRIETIVNILDIKNRDISRNVSGLYDLDWSSINERLDTFRATSEQYLCNIIS